MSAQEVRLRELLSTTEGVGRTVPEGVVFELPLHLIEAMTVFSRTRAHFMAIRMLAEHGLLEEGFALWRGLFTDSLRLAYLAAEPAETREAVFLHRQRESWRTMRTKFGDERVDLGLKGLTEEEKAAIDDQLRKIKARSRRLQVSIDRGYPSDRELAERFGQAEEYWVQRFASDAVHGNQLYLRGRVDRRGDITAISSRTFNVDGMSVVGILAMKAALRSHISVARVLEWESAPAFDHLSAVLAFEAELDARHHDAAK